MQSNQDEGSKRSSLSSNNSLTEKQAWVSVKDSGGTPLIEDIKGDEKNKKVTFFWEPIDSSLEQSVYLVLGTRRGCDYIEIPISEKERLKNIPDTNVYKISLELPIDLLTTYTFYVQPKGVNISEMISAAEKGLSETKDFQAKKKIAQAIRDEVDKNGNHDDENNPYRFNDPKPEQRHPILAMPLAPKNLFIPVDAEKKLAELKKEERYLECKVDLSSTKSADRADYRNYKFFGDMKDSTEKFFETVESWCNLNKQLKNLLILKDNSTNDVGLFCGDFRIKLEGELLKTMLKMDLLKKDSSGELDSLSTEAKQEIISFYLKELKLYDSSNRKYWVYLPKAHNKNSSPCRLLLQLDGKAYEELSTPSVIDKMIEDKEIPPTVVVFLDPSFLAERMKEYGCNDEFTSFLAEEFVPTIRKEFNCSTAAKDTIIAGSSMGGLAALYAGLTCGHVFGNVISQSGALWCNRDVLANALEQFIKAKGGTNFVMDAGKFETGLYDNPISLVEANSEFAVKIKKSYPDCHYSYSEFNGGHDYLCWQASWPNMVAKTFDNMLKADIGLSENKESNIVQPKIADRQRLSFFQSKSAPQQHSKVQQIISSTDNKSEASQSVDELKKYNQPIVTANNENPDISDDEMTSSAFGQASDTAKKLGK